MNPLSERFFRIIEEPSEPPPPFAEGDGEARVETRCSPGRFIDRGEAMGEMPPLLVGA